MSKKIGPKSSTGIGTTKGKSFRERFAEKSGKIALKRQDLEELIAALGFAAQCAGEQVAIEADRADTYGDAGLTAKTTRIFHLISAVAVELEQLQSELVDNETGNEKVVAKINDPSGRLLKELLVKHSRKPGVSENIRERHAKNIIGAAVVVLNENLGCKSRNAAIRAAEPLFKLEWLKAAGIEFNVKTVADWYAAVEPEDPDLLRLQMISMMPLQHKAGIALADRSKSNLADRREAFLESVARIIQTAG